MKIALYARTRVISSPGQLRALMSAIQDSGLEYCVNSQLAEVLVDRAGIRIAPSIIYDEYRPTGFLDADVIVSYGGDGTFLECVKRVGLGGIPIMGVNSGRLGFLANTAREEISEALENIANKRFKIQKNSLIKVKGDFGKPPRLPYAFNEFSIHRMSKDMIMVEAYVDGEMVATYWGDGVLLSTPAGSTAYSMSLGGPIVAPCCGCFLLTPIASHNLSIRPVVIPDTARIEFRVESRAGKFLAAFDNDDIEAPSGARFTAFRSRKQVFLAVPQNISYYDTLRNKLMWGFDRREECKK